MNTAVTPEEMLANIANVLDLLKSGAELHELQYLDQVSAIWQPLPVTTLEDLLRLVLVTNHRIRLRPKLIELSVSFPEPVRKPLKPGTPYYSLSSHLYDDRGICAHHWADDTVDELLLKEGRIHLTKEAARAHLNALNKVIAPWKK